MEERICTHKDCPHAGKPQSIGVFSKDRTKPSGLHPHCRDCRSRAARLRMESNPHARQLSRDAQARYRATDARKEYDRAYYVAHKDDYRRREREYSKRDDVKARKAAKQAVYREQNHDKECARRAVTKALRTGYLAIPANCEWCGQAANGERLEAHHWRGYDSQFWIDVKFVHATCHDACESVSASDWP